MKRLFNVTLVDNETGKQILKFKGIVVKKKGQGIIGNVTETLYLESYDIRIRKNTKLSKQTSKLK